MQKMSDLSNCKKDPHLKPSTGASRKVAQNIQMSCHSIEDYDHVRMHAKPHPRTLSINQDIRGGHNVPPPGVRCKKKVGGNRVKVGIIPYPCSLRSCKVGVAPM